MAFEPSEKLTIDTPEQIALEYHLAGIGSRFLAIAYDTLIQVVVYFLGFLLILFLFEDLAKYWPSAALWSAALWIFLGFTLYWGYYGIFEALWKGQTPGKRYAGIRVIKDSGRPISAFDAIARNLMRGIDSVPGFYGVGLLSMFLDKRNRRLGDMVAGTVVVHEKPAEEEVRPVLQGVQLRSAEAAPAAVVYPVVNLTAHDLQLIETFLHRRIELTWDVRAATSQRIADHLAARMQLNGQARPQSNEDFLEQVARDMRNTAGYR